MEIEILPGEARHPSASQAGGRLATQTLGSKTAVADDKHKRRDATSHLVRMSKVAALLTSGASPHSRAPPSAPHTKVLADLRVVAIA